MCFFLRLRFSDFFFHLKDETQWVLTPGFHIKEYRLMTQDLVSEFIPRAIQPGNCLPHTYKTHEPPNDSKIGVEQPYNYFNTIKTY